MLEIHPRLRTSSAVCQEYVDDENTLINLRANNDSFMDALRK